MVNFTHLFFPLLMFAPHSLFISNVGSYFPLTSGFGDVCPFEVPIKKFCAHFLGTSYVPLLFFSFPLLRGVHFAQRFLLSGGGHPFAVCGPPNQCSFSSPLPPPLPPIPLLVSC